MERRPIKVVHYINQFFGGIGGEDKADVAVQVREGAVGPGRALEEALGGRGSIAATIICGDNYAVEEEQALRDVKDALQRFVPDVVIAGPAFDSGRYGLACARVCMTAQSQGIAAITAMFPDNVGVITHGREIIAVPTGTSPLEMRSIMENMATLAIKLGNREKLGSAEEEGYIPRGFRRPIMRDKVGYERALDMLKARIEGRDFVSEIPVSRYETVPPAAPVTNLADATIAFVVSTGIVPKNNPDRLPAYRATDAFRYSIEGLDELKAEEWGSVHGGFNTAILNKKPDYGLPLAALRKLEAQGVVKKIYPYFYSTVGNSSSVEACKRMGEKVAQELKSAGVNAALEVAG